jgi:hypothetical protein
MRILAGLFLWDEKLQVATAQNRDLSLETFRQVIEVVDSFDWLRSKVKHITRSNGREEIEIKRLVVVTRLLHPQRAQLEAYPQTLFT